MRRKGAIDWIKGQRRGDYLCVPMREVVVGDVEQETPDVRDVGAAEPAVQAGRLALASHPGGHQVYSINKFTTPHILS